MKKLYENSEAIKKKLKEEEDKTETEEEVLEEDDGITPISPDLDGYNLLDKSKVEIIEVKQDSVNEILEKIIVDNSEEQVDKEEDIKTDPYLNEEYKGKPLKVKSLQVNMNKVKPKQGYTVCSTYHNTKMNQWVNEENVTHPYIAIQFSQINPRTLQEISHKLDIKAMADTGAQCSIFTFGAIRSIGVEPTGLKPSGVSIVGVGGKQLDGIVREICIKLVNRKTGTKSYEKIYVSPDVDKSILSKDTLYRLGVLDPSLFLNETEDDHNYSVNNLTEEIDKRTECEKSMSKDCLLYTSDAADE